MGSQTRSTVSRGGLGCPHSSTAGGTGGAGPAVKGRLGVAFADSKLTCVSRIPSLGSAGSIRLKRVAKLPSAPQPSSAHAVVQGGVEHCEGVKPQYLIAVPVLTGAG